MIVASTNPFGRILEAWPHKGNYCVSCRPWRGAGCALLSLISSFLSDRWEVVQATMSLREVSWEIQVFFWKAKAQTVRKLAQLYVCSSTPRQLTSPLRFGMWHQEGSCDDERIKDHQRVTKGHQGSWVLCCKSNQMCQMYFFLTSKHEDTMRSYWRDLLADVQRHCLATLERCPRWTFWTSLKLSSGDCPWYSVGLSMSVWFGWGADHLVAGRTRLSGFGRRLVLVLVYLGYCLSTSQMSTKQKGEIWKWKNGPGTLEH